MSDNGPYIDLSQDEERNPKLSVGYNSKKGWGAKFEGSKNNQFVSGYIPLPVGELNVGVKKNFSNISGLNLGLGGRVGYKVKTDDLINALRNR